MSDRTDDQRAIVEALRAPAAYPHAPDRVEHVQTHISHVFLAGAFVYKLKKAVVFPFLDFGTVVARRQFCEEEVRLNRRLAAEVYLDVLPVTRGRDGRLRAGGTGETVDWLVRMRRLPAERSLLALVRDGIATPAMLEAVARHLARFHAAAPVAAGGAPEALAAAWTENLDGVRGLVGHALAAEDFGVLADFGRTFVARHDAVLGARPALGHVRDGHGDLRAEHVYVLDVPAGTGAAALSAGIHVVDCIEFAPALRAVDVAADIAFLAMDLEALGRADLAAAFVAAYTAAADDPIVPALVTYYGCHRATVRGKVEALTAAEPELDQGQREAASGRSRAAFGLAARLAWRNGDPVVIACAGLSGSGKSTVAATLAEATGFAVVSSDVLRKAGRDAAPSYGLAAREQVYAGLRRETERRLGAGESVIVDATFTRRAERDRLARSARGYGRRHLFVECVADDDVVRARLETRDASSVSDARWGVYLQQRRAHDPFASDESVLPVDTSADVTSVRPILIERLWHWRQGRPLVPAPA